MSISMAAAQRPRRAAGSRPLLEAVLNNATVALFVTDQHQRCVYMNPAAERLTGYCLAEAEGRVLHELVHHSRPDGRPYPLAECPIDRAFPDNNRTQGEETFVHKDGSFYPVAYSASPIRDKGGVVGTVLEVRDLSDEMRAGRVREKAAWVEERLQFAREVSGTGLWDWNLETGELLWSEEVYRLRGLEPGSVTPSVELFLDSVHPDDRDRVRQNLDRAREGGALEYDYRVVRPDGGVRWAAVKGRAFANAAGKVVRISGAVRDVTARKQAEAALRDSARRLGNIAASFQGAIYRRVLYPDGRIEFPYISPGITRVTGLTPEFYRKVRSFRELKPYIHPDDFERWNEAVLRSVREVGPFEIEGRILTPEGETRWTRVSAFPVRDGDKVVWDGVILDTTEQRKAEAALLDGERRLTDIAANLHGAIYRRVLHPDGRIEYPYVSSGIANLIGITPEQYQALGSFAELRPHIHPDDFERWNEAVLRSAAAMSSFEIEARVLGPDGATRWVRVSAVPHRDGDKVVWDGVILDITEQRRTEAALRETEERARLAIEAAGLGTWHLDIATGIRGWSASMSAMLGLPAEDTEATQEVVFGRFIHPEDRARVLAASHASMEGLAPYDIEFRIIRTDGKLRWIASRGNVLRHADGTPYRVVGIAQDVTERKAAEERQALLMAELDHRVRNILAQIQAMVNLTGPTAPTKEAYAETLQGRVAAMARTHGLLTRQHWQGASLAEIVRDELYPYAESEAAVAVEGPDCIVKPKDALNFALVIHELATNAAKYGALSVPGGRVAVAWRIDGDDEKARLRLEWRESGGPPVIAPAQRGFGSTLIGTALGQAPSIEVRLDFPPAGVRCRIELPWRRVAADGVQTAAGGTTAPAPSPASGGPVHGNRVLLVEDELLVGLEMSRDLTSAGLEVVGPATTLAQAFALAENGGLAAAILDVNLGGDMITPFADFLIARDVPVLFVTGYDAGSVLPRRFRTVPAVQKPVAGRDLVRRLRELMAPA